MALRLATSTFRILEGEALDGRLRMRESVRDAAQSIFERPLAAAIVITSAAALFFFHLGTYGLWEPDEARYAEIAREMIESRDFIVPHLNYVAYVEKPPLLFWATTPWFEIFGANTLAARVTPALAALGCVVATYLFVAKTLDRRSGVLSAAILTTSPIFAVMAQVLTTDMILTLWITIATYAFFLSWLEGGRWRWLFYAALGLGALTKGPVALLIPAASAVVFLWTRGELAAGLRRLHLLSGLALVAAIAAPWFVAVSVREPGFVSFYLLGEHFRRVFEPGFSHQEPIYFYLPVILGGMLPWTMLMPLIRTKARPVASYCVIAASLTIGLFSLASGKLIPYVLPAVPPLAILIADGALAYIEMPKARSRLGLAPIALLPVIVSMGLIAWLIYGGTQEGYPALIRGPLKAAAVIVGLGGAAATFSFRRSGNACMTALAIMSAALVITASYARIDLEPMRSYDRLSREVAQKRPDAELISYGRYVQALPFYAKRRVILIGNPSELRFGAEHDRDSKEFFYPNDLDLIGLWKKKAGIVLVIDDRDLIRLAPQLGAFELIATENHKRAVANGSK